MSAFPSLAPYSEQRKGVQAVEERPSPLHPQVGLLAGSRDSVQQPLREKQLGVVASTLYPSTLEAITVSASKPAWSTWRVLGQSGIQSEIVSQKHNKTKTREKSIILVIHTYTVIFRTVRSEKSKHDTFILFHKFLKDSTKGILAAMVNSKYIREIPLRECHRSS